MPALSRMLVATDLSARSDRAVERAVKLASLIHAHLTVLHVVDAELPNRVADRLSQEAHARVVDHIAALPGAKGVNVDVKVIFGRDKKDIVAAAEASRAELVVLGLRRNESRELFRGTTAERVVRTSKCPVLMVTARPQLPYRRLVVGIDFSEGSRRAIEFAARLVPDGEFHLLHAFDVPFKGFLTGEETRREALKSRQEQMDRFVGKDLAGLGAALHAVPTRVFQIVIQGPTRKVVQEQVAHLKADLLVLGTHGPSGVAHAVLGSVAEDFLSHPPCDVLAVHLR